MEHDTLTAFELLALVEETFGSWMGLVESAPDNRLEEPGVSGMWSLKDIVAHIAWYEGQMVEAMRTRALIESEWWRLPVDDRNARIYDKYRLASLSDILDHAIATHEQLTDWIKTLKDADLNEPGRFERMPEDWLFGDILCQNTYVHYGDHAAAVARWLADLDSATSD